MAQTFCLACRRVTQHFIGHCADHSDWPPKNKPRSTINVVIPAYKPEVKPGPAPKPLNRKVRRSAAVVHRWDSKELEELGLAPLPPLTQPNALRCSFCREAIDEGRATYGKARMSYRRKLLAAYEEPPEFEDEVWARNDKVVACPNCCLKLRPITDRDGRIVTQGVTFPDFD